MDFLGFGFTYWFRSFPPFLLKEKVEPKVQGRENIEQGTRNKE